MLGRLVDVRAEERRPLLWASAYFFATLTGYYLLRPLRDEMGIRGGVQNLKWMFTATFVTMLLVVPAWSFVVARFARRRLVPIAYRFTAATLLAFWVADRLGVSPAAVARVFFVWVSVLALFIVAVLWSFLTDVFRRDQAKRLFGFIFVGGSAGAIAGPWLASVLASSLGTASLLVASAILLEMGTQCVLALTRWAESSRAGDFGRAAAEPVGGGILEGFRLALRSPYLLPDTYRDGSL